MPSDDISWEQSRPRIIQHDKKRYALRLERIFWDGLETIARRRHVRLGALVADLADQNRGVNFSSYIRAWVMADARREQMRQDVALTPFDIVDILRNCPAPGLLMQHNRTIVEVNGALLQWLGDNAPPLRQDVFDTVFAPRIARPLPATMDMMYHGQLKRTQMQVTYTPPMADGQYRAVPRTALATLHGLYNPAGAFYCLVWFSIGQIVPARALAERTALLE